MAGYTLTLPNGDELDIPEGATQEQVDEVIAGLGQQAAAPKADFTGVTSTASSAPRQSTMDKFIYGDSGMGVMENLAGAPERFKEAGQGIWDSLKDTGRAAQQIGATLMDDPEWQAELEAKEVAARQQAEQGTQGYRDAKLMGHIFQSAIPIGGAAKGAAMLGKGALGMGVAEGIAGAATGALQPTVKGESRKARTLIGGAGGFLVPTGGAALARIPGLRSVLANTPEDIRLAREATADTVKSRAAALKRQAGERIGELSKEATVRLAPMKDELKYVRKNFADAMESVSAGTKQQLDELIHFAEGGHKILPKRVQTIRTSLLRAEGAAEGAAKSGFESFRRAFDDAIDLGLPSKKVQEFRKVRKQYASPKEVAEEEVKRRTKAGALRGTAARVGAESAALHTVGRD